MPFGTLGTIKIGVDKNYYT